MGVGSDPGMKTKYPCCCEWKGKDVGKDSSGTVVPGRFEAALRGYAGFCRCVGTTGRERAFGLLCSREELDFVPERNIKINTQINFVLVINQSIIFIPLKPVL